MPASDSSSRRLAVLGRAICPPRPAPAPLRRSPSASTAAGSPSTTVALPPELEGQVLLFGIEHSYFCAKGRSYFRWKAASSDLSYTEISVTPALRESLLEASTGSPALPQVRLLDGRMVQDTSEIIDVLEALHPSSSAVPEGPRQRLVAYLVEFLADEWMNAYAFVRATAPAFAQTAWLLTAQGRLPAARAVVYLHPPARRLPHQPHLERPLIRLPLRRGGLLGRRTHRSRPRYHGQVRKCGAGSAVRCCSDPLDFGQPL